MTQKKRQLSHFLNFYVFLTVELPRILNGGRPWGGAGTVQSASPYGTILFSTVIEEKNERKAFEIGPNAHFYLDENVVWDLHFIIFF